MSENSVYFSEKRIASRKSEFRGERPLLLKTSLLLVLVGILGLFSSLSLRAEVITFTITGVGSGTLVGSNSTTEIVNTSFVWSLTYDTASYSSLWGKGQPIFLNPVSMIIVEGYPTPIRVTQEQGVWIFNTDHLYMAPISMESGFPAPNNTNILTIEGDTAWDGFSQPYQTSIITTADFLQFVNISTDQGLLTFSSNSSVSSVSANTPYLAWAAGIKWNGKDSSPGADPDRDGVVNLMEYALGGDPLSALSAPRPETQVSAANMLEISFLRAGPGLTYTVLASSDLITWSEIPYTPLAVGETQTVSDTAVLTDNTRRFLRLRVSQQQ